jgi:AraC-like DNA-binding protein
MLPGMNGERAMARRAHDDGVDRWEMIRAAPAARLAGRIDGYADYWERTGSFTARRELASTCGVLLYALGEPLEITGADGAVLMVKPGEAFVGGIADATSLSRGPGLQRGVHLHMPLASLAAVTGAPLAAIANRVVPFADLAGAAARELGQALGEARGPAARFALLDAFLERRFAAAPAPDPAIAWAMAQLGRAAAPHSAALARELGWSRTYLARRFRAATGFAPDRYRRLARFRRFAALVQRRPALGLAALAAEAGYFDQPHLTREVQDFAGMTPGELRARLIPGEGGVRD